ncbi:peptidase [Deinococcus irradiatisoli]|uniref:Peptidase n=1 Tax=Deinococcus irradiatisoli TaxID=2202254 RepID=A0A2Z3JHX9_9DEIO|nr:peptidase [Deinococcus irradiatisoli]
MLDRLDGGFRFIEPRAAWNGAGRLSLRARPEALSPQVSEALPGQALEVVLQRPDGWAWLRTLDDRYLGYARVEGLLTEAPKNTLAVTALRGHVYAAPKITAPILAEVCLGALVTRRDEAPVTDKHRRWLPVGEQGWLQEVCAAPLSDADPAELALRFIGTPYVWGGRSAWGLDCSGLTQVVFGAFGRSLPRDADMQQAALRPVEQPQRGDLAFFEGHVGLMLDGRRMVHANATAMAVSVDTLGEGEYGERLQADLLGFGRWTG